MYVLTHEVFNLRDKIKSESVKRDYGIDKYLTVDKAEHKIDMMKAVARAHGVPLNKVLFVDDKQNLIYDACAAGICGMHISNIVQLYEDIETK